MNGSFDSTHSQPFTWIQAAWSSLMGFVFTKYCRIYRCSSSPKNMVIISWFPWTFIGKSWGNGEIHGFSSKNHGDFHGESADGSGTQMEPPTCRSRPAQQGVSGDGGGCGWPEDITRVFWFDFIPGLAKRLLETLIYIYLQYIYIYVDITYIIYIYIYYDMMCVGCVGCAGCVGLNIDLCFIIMFPVGWSDGQTTN